MRRKMKEDLVTRWMRFFPPDDHQQHEHHHHSHHDLIAPSPFSSIVSSPPLF